MIVDDQDIKQLCQAMGLPQEWTDRLLNETPNPFETLLEPYRQYLADLREIVTRHLAERYPDCYISWVDTPIKRTETEEA